MRLERPPSTELMRKILGGNEAKLFFEPDWRGLGAVDLARRNNERQKQKESGPPT